MTRPPTVDDAELSRSRIELLRHALAACQRNGLPFSSAEDLVHDAIVELYECHERGKPPSCPQIAFLKRTIWKRAIDRIRETKRHAELLRGNHDHVPKPPTPMDDDAIAYAEIARRIYEELSSAVEAQGNQEAWFYLEALRDNPAGTREERMKASCLTVDRYEAAKKRVATLLNHVSIELRDHARDILGMEE